MPDAFENLAIFPDAELELIRSFMANEGIPEPRWLLGSGLDMQLSGVTGKPISLNQFDMIYRNVYRLANRPGLGIDLGLALNLSRWGMLSAALMCADSLGQALSIAHDFREILRSRFSTASYVKDGMMVIDLHPKADMTYPVNEIFAHEVFIGTLTTQISQLTAIPFRFSEIRVPYTRPAYAKHYEKVSQTPVTFNAAVGQLKFPVSLARQPLPMANRVTRQAAIGHCRDELDRVIRAKSGDIVFAVRSILAQRSGDLPGLAELADMLSMNPRTLRRKLQKAQMPYRQLCEQQRQQTAISLLASTELSVQSIGERCGFKDYASFHKAFKRWTGQTITQYRASQTGN
ncbi:putative HTH-type transcriptional regulator [BD1-7 clade bacterium]|uniref:Putative HTH-type transcriptional regulator n=1 Tax=BD1-7 clade bacterium TaxID=2029982 RepID=A0A5S9NQ92_9GAMM|nr:putative HTH-type transcriptional regulator [BD1-7 clade bacterium]